MKPAACTYSQEESHHVAGRKSAQRTGRMVDYYRPSCRCIPISFHRDRLREGRTGRAGKCLTKELGGDMSSAGGDDLFITKPHREQAVKKRANLSWSEKRHSGEEVEMGALSEKL